MQYFMLNLLWFQQKERKVHEQESTSVIVRSYRYWRECMESNFVQASHEWKEVLCIFAMIMACRREWNQELSSLLAPLTEFF
jgi:hypothetical protein